MRPRDGRLTVEEVAVAAVTLPEALPVLLAGPERTLPPWRQPPDSLLLWSRAARLGVGLVARRLLAPTLRRADDERIVGVWRALVDADPAARAAAEHLAAAMPPAAAAVVADDGTVPTCSALLHGVLDAIADLCARDGAGSGSGRPRARLLPWTARWLEALSDPTDPLVPLRGEAEEILAGVEAWQAPSGVADLELTLHAPDDADAPWHLDLALRDERGVRLSAADVWAGDTGGEHAPEALQERLLEGLGRCARVFPPLDAALAVAEPSGIDLDLDDAWTFLHDAAPVLSAAGVLVTLPEDVAQDTLRLRLRVHEHPADADALEGGLPTGGEAEVRAEVTLDGEPVDEAALAVLLAGDRPLLRTGGRWVRIDPRLHEQLEALRSATVPLSEALLLGLAGSVPLATLIGEDDGAPAVADTQVDVAVSGRLATLIERLREGVEGPHVGAVPAGFEGTLRPYQRRGAAWLATMASLGLGAVLADAMGLGKTVELIAHLLGREGDGPHLVVCPTSVVGNWERELARFAPGLDVTTHHGPQRAASLDGVKGVVVTSYGLLRRNADPLLEVDWDVVTLDEAQHVKNPRTAGARAVRTLRARQRVALTGTPLENRLGELWAVLDVTNPGLLGTRARFGRRFVTPIEQRRDMRAAARLRRMVAPFVLRREKRDVLDDLPDKIEREVACTLTPEQARLYEQAVQRALGDELASSSPMQRRGRVLALLTALKQICNHPAQFLGEKEPGGLLGRSGKLAAMREIVAEAVAAGDQVLLFTQYVEMGKLLVAQLSADLDTDVPFLHGGLALGARDRLVAAFQGERGPAPPVLVVSLRAGGTGLNLTAATHVVHYDRWWNPAVEDQATDRAHRIGQRRTVEVHKLVTAGTVEERIAAMLERKRGLAEAVVGPGEQWITELGDAELWELVRLSAPGEELDDDDPFDDDYGRDGFEEAS